jgi:hypothetical protein
MLQNQITNETSSVLDVGGDGATTRIGARLGYVCIRDRYHSAKRAKNSDRSIGVLSRDRRRRSCRGATTAAIATSHFAALANHHRTHAFHRTINHNGQLSATCDMLTGVVLPASGCSSSSSSVQTRLRYYDKCDVRRRYVLCFMFSKKNRKCNAMNYWCTVSFVDVVDHRCFLVFQI